MFRPKKLLVAMSVAASLVGSLAACGSGDGGEDASDTLTLGMIVPPQTFAAADAAWANETPYMQAVYDTLLQAEPDGTIVPGLARSFEWDESRTQLTLELRDDVTFTDGTAFDADVAVQNLERFRDGTSSNASYLVDMVSATASDESTVVLEFAQPNPAVLTYLAQNAGLQESPEAFDNPDVSTAPVGSGPYILDTDATVPSSSYVFTRNPDYWNPDQQHYDRVVMNVYNNPTTVLNAIQAGQVDASSLIDVSTDDQVRAAGFDLSPQLSETWNGLVLADRGGQFTPALGDVRVRQAINYALDRDALLETVINGVGVTTQQIFPAASPSFDAELDSYYDYDPERARDLLAEAGYPDGFTLSMPTADVVPPSTYALISAQLADIGITVQETAYPIGQIFGVLLEPQYSAFYFQLQEDPNDYQLSQFSISESATWNPFHTADPQVAGWISTIQTGSEDEAAEAGQSLNAYLVENAWFAPFYRPTFSYASNPETVTIEMQVGGATPQLWNFVPVA